MNNISTLKLTLRKLQLPKLRYGNDIRTKRNVSFVWFSAITFHTFIRTVDFYTAL